MPSTLNPKPHPKTIGLLKRPDAEQTSVHRAAPLRLGCKRVARQEVGLVFRQLYRVQEIYSLEHEWVYNIVHRNKRAYEILRRPPTRQNCDCAIVLCVVCLPGRVVPRDSPVCSLPVNRTDVNAFGLW